MPRDRRTHLREILLKYVDYYNGTRTHLSLSKDAPKPRTVQLPSQGRVVKVPRVGGLHHEYRRRGHEADRTNKWKAQGRLAASRVQGHTYSHRGRRELDPPASAYR